MSTCTRALLIAAIVAGLAMARTGLPPAHPTGGARNDMGTLVTGNNAFALDLYSRLRREEGNLFFSPFSLSTALAVTYSGAAGQTATQMSRVLNLPTADGARPGERGDGAVPGPGETEPWPPDRLHAAFGALIRDVNARQQGDHYRLTVANALWGQEGYDFLDAFLDLVRRHYRAGLNEVDFAADAEGARRTINEWVEHRTEGMIEELIPRGVLNALTRLVLTNAIYFKGDWAEQFESEETAEATFTLTDGSEAPVQMMHQTDTFGYMESPSFQALELPYQGDDLSMVVLLPREPHGLPTLEEQLTVHNLEQWCSDLRRRKVQVYLPRFTMTSQFSLARVLKSLGMTDAFDPNAADFSGMNGRKDLYLTAVVHKARVEVNEEGTEAAAATGVVVGVTSIGPMAAVFRADHPFLFLIRDTETGSILFLGRLAEPTEAD